MSEMEHWKRVFILVSCLFRFHEKKTRNVQAMENLSENLNAKI